MTVTEMDISNLKTVCMRVYGIVQGVGFRPSVSRHAAVAGVTGSVSNTGPYVEIIAQGKDSQVKSFAEAVVNDPPERAVILKYDIEELASGDSRYRSYSRFEIIESDRRAGEIFVSPDIATCGTCRNELYDPSNRRYLHPFINCTCCGPRLTILDGMPYDRERTSMAQFPMCSECHDEYVSPDSRRYDAQPVCCNSCGPALYLIGRKYYPDKPGYAQLRHENGASALRAVRHIIADGGITAVKGIGGFHLCCSAMDEAAVQRLRDRKKRPYKPFAVMMKDMDTVRRECNVTPEQEKMLTGHQKPIVLLERRRHGRLNDGECENMKLCEAVAPGNPKIGVMLPYAPVQMLIFDYPGDDAAVPDCLIMTSGNTSGAPICRDDEDAERELGGLCDAILSNDRLIRIRADDSVMDHYRGKPYMIRRSRGFAPLPFMVSGGYTGSVLATGGELKNTFCISKNELFYPSPYIGDMEDVRTVRAHKESVKRMAELLEAKPELVVCDMHPGYHSTESAYEISHELSELENPGNNTGNGEGKPYTEYGGSSDTQDGRSDGEVKLIKVQHHYAHILSCMAENDTLGPVIGVSFDGTGYGLDGSIWGGEIMTADPDSFERRGCIEPFIQSGGDMAAREGWRIAVSLLGSSMSEDVLDRCGFRSVPEMASHLGLCDENSARVQLKMAELGVNSVRSTSAGRLFDAVSAVLGICTASTYEGDASTRLQFAAEKFEKNFHEKARRIREYVFNSGSGNDDSFTGSARRELLPGYCQGMILPYTDSGLLICRTGELFSLLVMGRLQKMDPGELGYIFHVCLAAMTVNVCMQISAQTGIRRAALSGGVYQNLLFLRLCMEMLESRDIEVLTHSMIPPNDGGICLGQALYGARYLQKLKKVR